jgi:hypothetical protein
MSVSNVTFMQFRPPIHAFGLGEPEIYSGEFFKPIPVEAIKAQIRGLFYFELL